MEVLVNAAGGAPVPEELRHVADLVQEWGAPRGWRVARDVPKQVLKQFPGQPFHEFRRKQVPVLAAGAVDGAPAVVLQVDFTIKYQSSGGSTSSSAGGMRSTGKTKKKTHPRTAIVVELPAPVPEVVLMQARDVLDDVLHLFKLNRTFQMFRGPSKGTGSERLDALYRVEGESEEHIRSVINPDRVQWLYNKNAGPYPGVRLEQTCFRLTGRTLVLWVNRPVFDPAVLDGLVATVQEVRRWIPNNVFQSTDTGSGFRVSSLQLPVS
ncbi:hypothetical protein IQ251_10985 [Saccharopolyspora sp. HNM0983]|uniref:Uncharacterized protein n=1 Tax=Saccharopolyspora montiporae TaxID=2781240 RepID=A0A929G039_9PSEU|nr:hypothetical protein [Saccharopolyspora sp. HNM0983]MBE9374964.1 hypothetical protein [Saccharopolyspora sp. HNM0983]